MLTVADAKVLEALWHDETTPNDFDRVLIVANRAVELVAARGGTIAQDVIKHMPQAFREHSASQGAAVATLQAKVAELEKAIASARADLGEWRSGAESTQDELAAAKSEVERLKAESRARMALILAAESRLAAIRAELCAHEQEDGPDLLATLEGIRAALDGAAPNPSTASDGSDTMPTAQQHEDLQRITGHVGCGPDCPGYLNSGHTHPEPDEDDAPGCARFEHCADSDHDPECPKVKRPTVLNTCICQDGTTDPCLAAHHPCSDTCTHDDAAKVGHPERVKERSEAFNAAGICAAEQCERHSAYDMGAEAMRAACWEAVKGQLQVFAMGGGIFAESLKRAIEGAAP